MPYSLRIKASAAKSPKKISGQIGYASSTLSTGSGMSRRPGGVLKGEFSGLRRLRVGDYRVIYEVSAGELVILIVRIGHRKDVYR